jgi:hypothetical protein
VPAKINAGAAINEALVDIVHGHLVREVFDSPPAEIDLLVYA